MWFEPMAPVLALQCSNQLSYEDAYTVDFIQEWNEVCMLKFHVGLMTDDALRQQIGIQWNMAIIQGSETG